MITLSESKICPFSGKKCTSECQLHIGGDIPTYSCIFQQIAYFLEQTMDSANYIAHNGNV